MCFVKKNYRRDNASSAR